MSHKFGFRYATQDIFLNQQEKMKNKIFVTKKQKTEILNLRHNLLHSTGSFSYSRNWLAGNIYTEFKNLYITTR